MEKSGLPMDVIRPTVIASLVATVRTQPGDWI